MARFATYEDAYRINVVTHAGAAGDGVTNDTTAINTALATSAAHVYFPPGTYAITGAVTGIAADQTITFAPGAKLLLAPATASVTFSGARQVINGISISISATNTRTFSALTISGAYSFLKGARFDITADIPNTSLLQLAEDDIEARDIYIFSNFSFFRGVSLTKVDDSGTRRPVVDGLRFLPLPSGSQTLGSLINIHGTDTLVKNLQVTSGGNTTYSEGVIRIRSSNVTLINPQVFCFGAQYGIYGEDSASEKVTIFQGNIQGRNNATYVSGSEGYRVGHQSGHQKVYGTYINGWENGVVFHGSADTPGFYGAVICNNDQYAFVIDAGTDIGAVRGLNIIDCYLSDVTQDSFMHVISGKLDACFVAGSEIGYGTVAILVEDAVQSCGMLLSGNFIQGSGGGVLGIAQPNAASDILFIHNTLQGGNTYGTGTNASRAMELLSPTLGTATVTTSLKVGSNGNPWLRRYFTFFTANYGSGIPANDMVELDFSWADGAVATYMLTFGVSGALAANTDLSFTAYVKATGTVTLRARNHSASPVDAISGTVHFEATKNF